MELRYQQHELDQLPLPLAQLLARISLAGSREQAHFNSYYLLEATLILAAVYRLAAYHRYGGGAPALDAILTKLNAPTPGLWTQVLLTVSEVHASRSDADLLPFAGTYPRLLERREDLHACREWMAEAKRCGLILLDDACSQKQFSLADVFRFLAAYRNRVIGHGGMPAPEIHGLLGTRLRSAALEILQFYGETLLGSYLLCTPLYQEGGAAWHLLRGESSVIWPEARAVLAADPATYEAGSLYLAGSLEMLPLFPFLLYRKELGNDEIGVLNRAWTRRNGSRRAMSLNYRTGLPLTTVELDDRFVGWFRSALQRPVSLAELAPDMEEEKADVAVSVTSQEVGGFVLEQKLGAGAMGIVYSARQTSTNRRVALKVLRPAIAAEQDVAVLFRREIEVLAQCSHPNLVRILAAGEDGARQYFAMDLIEGRDLGHVFEALVKVCRPGQSLSAEMLTSAASGDEAVLEKAASSGGGDYFRQLTSVIASAASGVEELHRRGFLHRDLKPSNIMLTADGLQAVVLDLGLVRQVDASAFTQISHGLIGTPRYMPPERLNASEAGASDTSSDVYSLGATLYELATLKQFYSSPDGEDLQRKKRLEEPVSPRVVNPEVPKPLAAIIEKATRRYPDLRYRTAKDFHGALAFRCGSRLDGSFRHFKRDFLGSQMICWRSSPACRFALAALVRYIGRNCYGANSALPLRSV